MNIKLTRLFSNKKRMVYLLRGPGLLCFTFEPHKSSLSSIPAGIYNCQQMRSPRFGWVYEVQSVPGRSDILIHSGNLAGHRSFGLISHAWRCILFDYRVSWLGKQLAYLNSLMTVQKSPKHLHKHNFTLEVTSCWKH